MSKTIIECPLDRKCFDEEANKRCLWFLNFPVKDAEGKFQEDWRCALVWIPVLEIELLMKLETLNKREDMPVSH